LTEDQVAFAANSIIWFESRIRGIKTKDDGIFESGVIENWDYLKQIGIAD